MSWSVRDHKYVSGERDTPQVARLLSAHVGKVLARLVLDIL